MKKNLFCAACQAETEQTFEVSQNGKELVATCVCKRQVKFPSSLTKDQLAAAFAAHKASNAGQVAAGKEPDHSNHDILKHLAAL